MKQQRSYPAVQVTAKGERAIKNGHPWVYGAELTGQTGTPENGGLVDVYALCGRKNHLSLTRPAFVLNEKCPTYL